MHTVKLPVAMSLVENVAIGMNHPVMIWGPPGCGKSEGIQQLVTRLKATLVDVRLSQYDSVDLRGFPGISKETDLTCWHPPSTMPFEGNDAFPDDRPIVLFLDEVNSASPSVLAVAYQLVNEKRVGEHKLKPNVHIVAAGNRETDRGVTTRMPLPLANRFDHVEVGVDVDAWCLWAQDTGLPPEGVAFFQFRKPLLNTFDPSKPDKAFATPRSVEKMLRYWMSDMREDVKMAAMAGAVGDGVAAEFWGFLDVWGKIIPIKDILKDPTGAPIPEPSEMGMMYATAVNVSGNMEGKTIKPLYTYLKRMPPEFVVLAWSLLIQRTKHDNKLHQEICSTDAFMDYAKTFKSLLTND